MMGRRRGRRGELTKQLPTTLPQNGMILLAWYVGLAVAKRAKKKSSL
jgi:hypothetical protein